MPQSIMAVKKLAKHIRRRYEPDSFTVEASQKEFGPFKGWLLFVTYPILTTKGEIMRRERSLHETKKTAEKEGRKARDEHPRGTFAVMPHYDSGSDYNVGGGP